MPRVSGPLTVGFLEDLVAGLLLRSDAIAALHRDYQLPVRQRLCDWGREVLSAHLRGSKQPQTPAFLREYEDAITESEEMLASIEAETATEIEPGRDEPDA